MEGKDTKASFSKKRFQMGVVKTKLKPKRIELPKNMVSGSNSKESSVSPKSLPDFNKSYSASVSQVSTQPDLNYDVPTASSLTMAQEECLTQAKPFESTEKILSSNIYTQEESDDENKSRDAPSEHHDSSDPDEFSSPQKCSRSNKSPVKASVDNILLSNTYTQEESDNEKKSEAAPSEDQDSNDSDEISLPQKRSRSKKSPVKAPRIMNKMLNLKTEISSENLDEPESYLDEEIQIVKAEKPKPFSFLEKFTQSNTIKVKYMCAKGVLEDSNHEFLEIKAPERLEGFIMKQKTVNPRELMRENLRKVINDRKTTHIEPDMIFSKAATDLLGRNHTKAQKEEDEEDDDYVPEDNEETEALELEKMIRLEDGSEEETEKSSHHSTESKSSEATEDEALSSQVSEADEEPDQPIEEDLEGKMDIDTPEKLQNPEEKLIEELSEVSSEELSPEPVQVFQKPIKLSKFFEKEAELGSDHEDHDDLIKYRRDSEDEDNEENDKDLEEIIDRQDVDDDEDLRYNKHLNQLFKDDDEQIQKVVNAEFRKQRKDIDFIESTNIMSKKDKLLEERKKILANRGNTVFSQGREDYTGREEMDDEEFSRFKVLKSSQELKFIRSQFGSKVVLDEKSLSYLSLLSKPENSITSKSLLSDSERSNSSMRVFKTSTELTSNRSFVFSKDKIQATGQENYKKKKTKLFKLLSN